tara:strand:+ start:138 stop:449 length:312 start_codon:yes stop_codon:yes gene_type:complete
VDIRSNDQVTVLKGKDRGKQGRVTQVFPKQGKVLVEGMNLVKKHTKATGAVSQAGIIQKELPIRVSNVMLICTHCNEPSRLARKILDDGTKARVCKKCKEVIE